MARRRKVRDDIAWDANTPDRDEWWQEKESLSGVNFAAHDITPPPEDGGYIRLRREIRVPSNTSFAQMCVQDPAAGLEL